MDEEIHLSAKMAKEIVLANKQLLNKIRELEDKITELDQSSMKKKNGKNQECGRCDAARLSMMKARDKIEEQQNELAAAKCQAEIYESEYRELKETSLSSRKGLERKISEYEQIIRQLSGHHQHHQQNHQQQNHQQQHNVRKVRGEDVTDSSTVMRDELKCPRCGQVCHEQQELLTHYTRC